MNNLDHLEYCKQIFNIESEYKEINYRNVVTKSYYFAFYETVDKLNLLGWKKTVAKGGVHAIEVSRLLGFPEKQLTDIEEKLAKKLHYRITALKKLRTKADYKLDQPISERMAQYCIVEAEDISNQLQNIN
ncbi:MULTISPECIES: hypothetical protein [Acinetobacter]|uniref:HEPN domain-containing protein n=1 Tax=Acinetobacter higginsii TaxID=70347 RepID=N9T366_9GAMM|nr:MULTISPECIES: hypothetical protein [Acinetobacter]ENX58137.1 hypothetical protein F902_02537 [Acinetobacter higginsii]